MTRMFLFRERLIVVSLVPVPVIEIRFTMLADVELIRIKWL